MPGDFGDSTSGRHQDFGTVDPYAPSVANGGITPEQWAEYQKQRKRSAILGILGTVGGMLGGGALSHFVGGGGSAASAMDAGLPSGMLPGGAMINTTFPGTLGAGGGIGAGTSVAAAGGAGAAKGILGGLSARDLAALGLSGASMIGSALSDKPNMTPTTQTADPNLAKLIATMQGRLDKSEPLYGSILDMANGLLPTQYQKGGGGRT